MHVAGVMVFEGDAARLRRARRGASSARLHLVPRYRQKLAHVPLGQGRPVWVDDPHFNPRYHVRHSALPAPGTDEQLKQPRRAPVRPAAGPHQAAVGDLARRGPRAATASRSSPRPTTRSSTASAASTSPRSSSTPRPTPRPRRARRRVGAAPEPTERRAARPRRCSSARRCRRRSRAALRALTRAPRQRPRRRASGSSGVGAMAWAGLSPAPPSPLQRADRPAPALHVGRRRPRALQGDQERARRHAQRRGPRRRRARARPLPAPPRRATPTGSCSRRWSRCRCAPTTQRGALGNRVAAMWAPLPVGVTDPEAVFAEVHEAMRGLKESGQAVGAAGADLAGRLRAADDHVARPRGCRRASASSTSS